MKEDNFTPTQVGTLLEAMDKKIDLITEIVLPLRNDMVDVKKRLTNLEFDVRLIKDVIRIEIPSMRSRISALEGRA